MGARAVWPSARIGIWWGERPREPGRRGKDGLTTARKVLADGLRPRPTNAAAPTGLYSSPVGTGEGGRRPDEGGKTGAGGCKDFAPDGAANRRAEANLQ
jgi:hypothetical protein